MAKYENPNNYDLTGYKEFNNYRLDHGVYTTLFSKMIDNRILRGFIVNENGVLVAVPDMGIREDGKFFMAHGTMTMFHINCSRDKLQEILNNQIQESSNNASGETKFKTETTEYGLTKISKIGKQEPEEINPNTGKTRTQMMDRANFLIQDIKLNKSILESIKKTSPDLVDVIERNSKAIQEEENELTELFKYIP